MQSLQTHDSVSYSRAAAIHCGRTTLVGELTVPPDPGGIIVFAHGSGSSRLSARNLAIAESFTRQGFATLLLDLLTRDEEVSDRHARDRHFDIELLAGRLVATVDWIERQPELALLPVGLFGASTGAAAALVAATRLRNIAAIVSRSGSVDLAGDSLAEVTSPTLLIVGERDGDVLELNHRAMKHMRTTTAIHVVPNAGHVFDEIGALREVTNVAAMWFRKQFESARWRRQHPDLFD
jgi:putative phosphoribosyl transferase